MASGPVIIGFDGTAASERAVRAAAELLSARPALVVVVVEESAALSSVIAPAVAAGLPLTELEIRNAELAVKEVVRRAERTAQEGVALALELGLKAEGRTVVDDVPVATSLLRVAKELDAPVIVVGAHRRGALSELFLGSTAKEVLKRSQIPALIVREIDDDQRS